MKRVIILMMDSFGIGASADADTFGDSGADTFGHIAAQAAIGYADQAGLRQGPLQIPNLAANGLYHAAASSTGIDYSTITQATPLAGAYGYAAEMSYGKDTPSGHWELAGLPVLFDWGSFSTGFPPELIEAFIQRANLPGVLGLKHASGTTILEELGDEHIATGKPIVYTSADSVFQIAAHEQHFGLQRLYDCCLLARELVDDYQIGRVIARPFIGSEPGDFKRTGNRRDYSTPPYQATLLDHLQAAGGEVIAIGKIADIYAHCGVTQVIKADGNMALFDATLSALEQAGTQSLIFTNFVDFDMLYGHRRNVAGYAAALEAFDQRLPELKQRLRPGDLVLMTADHGCDPTWPGSDHTREHVPVLMFGPGVKPVNLGQRQTMADMGQTIAEHLSLVPLNYGQSFLTALFS